MNCLTDVDLMSVFYFEKNSSKKIALRIETPAAFKQRGIYVFTPDVHLLLHSLQQKFNALHEGTPEVDPEELAQLTERVSLNSYHLKSSYFTLGRGAQNANRIPAFMGTLKLDVRGSAGLCGYVRMLLSFGEYAGIGIKTSMGMGGMQVLEGGEQ
jgi:CRISPR-associated endoribonuclease Cas6